MLMKEADFMAHLYFTVSGTWKNIFTALQKILER